MKRSLWLIPLAAFLAVLPLIAGGPSCGKDLGFHLQSWFDAAAQLRHGTLYPRWTFAAAYNSGEPRFIFYPPISWMTGGLLALVFPFRWLPVLVAWIALTISGFSMHRLTRTVASDSAAILAACLYLANPFMIFSLATRSAYGELFAAAWCPLLILALIETKPTILRLGIPLALT